MTEPGIQFIARYYYERGFLKVTSEQALLTDQEVERVNAEMGRLHAETEAQKRNGDMLVMDDPFPTETIIADLGDVRLVTDVERNGGVLMPRDVKVYIDGVRVRRVHSVEINIDVKNVYEPIKVKIVKALARDYMNDDRRANTQALTNDFKPNSVRTPDPANYAQDDVHQPFDHEGFERDSKPTEESK